MKKYILSHPYFCVDRYGSVFKSPILACPTVISMDQELNRYILMNEGKGLVPGRPILLCMVLLTNSLGGHCYLLLVLQQLRKIGRAHV